jgi:glycosyltransferase involved in cell wall biosynthesis
VSAPTRDYVLFFGRYDVAKGIKVILEAVKNLPELDFVFAGKGEYEAEINKYENIKNVGFQDSESMQILIQNAKFTVFPSVWYENCPFSVIESIINRTPVVGANLGGVPELLENGKTGILYNADDSDELTKIIAELWDASDKLQEMYENCSIAAKDGRYDTLDVYCDKLVKEIYKK